MQETTIQEEDLIRFNAGVDYEEVNADSADTTGSSSTTEYEETSTAPTIPDEIDSGTESDPIYDLPPEPSDEVLDDMTSASEDEMAKTPEIKNGDPTMLCPGDSLDICVSVCPGTSANIYRACVQGCGERCDKTDQP